MDESGEITLEQIFGPDGLLKRHLPSYEYRPSQLTMASAVLEAIQQRNHLCVEAGTGTGKTLAYLIPALFSRKRVIISTATRNLQEQLYLKDIPFVRRYLFPQLKAAYMKGRHNYLCWKRFHDEAGRGLLFGLEQGTWERLRDWADQTATGDRSELDWIPENNPMWRHLDARSEVCVGQKCSKFSECFITRMRQKALESNLIIVNHALFFSHLALEKDEIGRVLPDFGVLILDEAHETEDTAAEYFGCQTSNLQFYELIRDLSAACSDHRSWHEPLARLEKSVESFFARFPAGDGRFSLNLYPENRERIDLRNRMRESFEQLMETLQVLYHGLERGGAARLPDSESLTRRVVQLRSTLQQIFEEDDGEQVYWFEQRGRGIYLRVTPIDIAPLLQEKLFSKVDSVILTSATLTTANHFGYIKNRLGVPRAGELIVPGEFDYRKQAMLYIPRDLPDPRSPDFFLRALKTIRQLLAITEGHAFLLFTSFQQMHRVENALRRNSPYPLLRQGEAPRNRLLEQFKNTPQGVLLATSSFWQGVDVQGDALRLVVIDKLPFQVPDQPLVSARIRRLEREGENAFYRYSVPNAVINLKQGLGRLIRSKRDRGILAVLDSRLWSRSYGRIFFTSLPNCPVTDNMDTLKNFYREIVSVNV